jgi:hypothetical protein
VCNPGFVPTNGEHKIAGRVENHCNHPKHGVVCRRTDGSGHWHAPKGCSKTPGFPFAVHTASGARCTISCACSPPESADYTLISTVGIPTSNKNWDTAAQVPYKVKNAVPAKITKVAYCMKLNNKWIWSSFDNTNSKAVGVPTDYKLDTTVKNLNVFSNDANVKTAFHSAGKVEFWDNCYGQSGGNSRKFDHDDTTTQGNCYGSMQIHQGTKTVMAFNGWSHGSHCDVAIGPNANAHGTDGTFLRNCNSYANAQSEIRTYVKETTEKIEMELELPMAAAQFNAAAQAALKLKLAAQFKVDPAMIKIEIGMIGDSRRLLEAASLKVRVTIVAAISKAPAVMKIAKSPVFAAATGSKIGEILPGSNSGICATCTYDSKKIQVTHYRTATQSNHRCFHADGECSCVCK